MATEFSTQPVAAQPGPYQQHLYKSSMNYSMQSGHNTPVNVSPTSPRSTANLALHPNNAPQIRPRQQPIYVPAALRRTEKPVRQSPPKIDSAVETPNSSWSFGAGFPQSPGEGMPGGLARIATEDLHTLNNDVPLSPVSGPITRNHWKPDSSTDTCSASVCHVPFTFFNRRHHCRKCGGIFCWQHSSKRVKLNEHALFHPEGDLERACDRCYSQFREWQQLRTSRANSESSGSGSTGALPVSTPVSTQRPETHRVGSLASSVQGAFNWSTF